MKTMLEHIGGKPAVRALVTAFHERALDDPLLGAMFSAGKPTHVRNLTTFFVEMMGGPPEYSERLGAIAGLYEAHQGLAITEEQRERFVHLMVEAADDAGLPDDERFRNAFAHHIAAGSVFSMKFSHPNDARPPFPDIEPWSW